MRAKKTKVGDVCEVRTPAGLAYVQYTHDGLGMGELVRVLPGLFDTRPSNFDELASQKELYFVFYTLNYAVRDKQTEIVSYQPVPAWAQPYPLMRWRVGISEGRSAGWKIFRASDPLTIQNHQRTPVLQSLTQEQLKISIHHLWPPPVMARQLARGWTPERAEELQLQDYAEGERRRAHSISEPKSPEPMKHFFYFPKKRDAELAGEELRGRGFAVRVRKGADGGDWLTLAMNVAPESDAQMDDLRNGMESLATQFGGEYDGWEAAIDSVDLPDPASKPN